MTSLTPAAVAADRDALETRLRQRAIARLALRSPSRLDKADARLDTDSADEIARLRERIERLEAAAIALRDDMLVRAESKIDVIRGEEYRIVNAGRTAWHDFCTALAEGKGEAG